MLKLALIVAGVISLTASAYAKSGAELLQDNEMFGTGFVWGAISYMLDDYELNDDLGNRLTKHRNECLSKAGATPKTMYDSVLGEIRSDPGTLSRSATTAIDTVVYKMCGPPPD
ncbi:hypothetical protein [Mesorhizobium loti]|uniref:hypothetical protein n=1 Tax=Rhizobium loti TaxID=381 RepID=UPI00047A887E|nr:hypothetical protein [Mesorhizobium loti]